MVAVGVKVGLSVEVGTGVCVVVLVSVGVSVGTPVLIGIGVVVGIGVYVLVGILEGVAVITTTIGAGVGWNDTRKRRMSSVSILNATTTITAATITPKIHFTT